MIGLGSDNYLLSIFFHYTLSISHISCSGLCSGLRSGTRADADFSVDFNVGPELGIKFISLYMYTPHAVKLNWISIYDMGMTMTLA